jgi:hypothetical protein
MLKSSKEYVEGEDEQGSTCTSTKEATTTTKKRSKRTNLGESLGFRRISIELRSS